MAPEALEARLRVFLRRGRESLSVSLVEAGQAVPPLDLRDAAVEGQEILATVPPVIIDAAMERAQRQKVPLRRPGAASSAVGTGQAESHDARSLRLRREELLARRVAERHAQAQNLRARHIAEAERLMRLHRDLTLRNRLFCESFEANPPAAG
jgi:hypothetical protein